MRSRAIACRQRTSGAGPEDPVLAAPSPWWSSKRSKDLLALLVLLGLAALFGVLGWARMPVVLTDQGWGMQVAVRILEGDSLYGDVTWSYGPLPVYAFVLLFKLFGVDVQMFSLVGLVLATLVHLFTYCISRHLLPPGRALGATVIVLFAVQGGFRSYMAPYTTAVSWGALFGLLTVWGLLISIDRKTVAGGLLAGVSSGCTLLAKPEFAAACVGTCLFYMVLTLLFPSSSGRKRGSAGVLVVVYLASVAVVAGVALGFLALDAGWIDVWSGLSGYRTIASELSITPWLGSTRSWLYNTAGVGTILLFLLLFVGLSAPRLLHRRRRLMLGGGLILGIVSVAVLLPLTLKLGIRQSISLAFHALSPKGLQEVADLASTIDPLHAASTCLGAVNASGSVFLVVMVLTWGLRAVRRRSVGEKTLSLTGRKVIVLAIYGCLATARWLFNAHYAWYNSYLTTLVPLAMYFFTVWLPQRMACHDHPMTRMRRGYGLLLAAMLLWAAASFWLLLRLVYLPFNLPLTTPRGTVMSLPVVSDHRMLECVLAETEPDEHIWIMAAYPGLYFLSGRANPTRWDYLGRRISYPPAVVREIASDLERAQPRLIITSKDNSAWFLDTVDVEGRISAFLRENYRIKMVIRDYFQVYEWHP
jgi:hypothetical protein